MSLLSELAAEISKWLVGDLKDRDIAFVIRGNDGKDQTVMILPDPIVRAVLSWMTDDGEGKDILQRIVDSVYDYGAREQSFHVVSMDMRGSKSRDVPLGGKLGAHIIYKKMFVNK